jgi:glycosyltransferase involved in cell wall biosynthesis
MEPAKALAGARIVMVLGGLVSGGAERQALLLADHLLHVQHSAVQIWAFRDPRWAAARCDELGIPWRIVPLEWSVYPWRQLPALRRLVGALGAAQPDAIVSYTRLPNMLCGLVWRLTGARTFIWHQTGPAHMGGWLEKLSIHLTPRLIARAGHMADFLVRSLGARADHVRVVYGGIRLAPPQFARDAWRARLGVADDCFVGCMVAHLKPRKDHMALIHAWRRVADRLEAQGRSSLLVLAGRPGRAQATVQATIDELRLGDQVKLLGEVEDVAGLLSASEVGLFTSCSEGLPNAVLEYMAAGLPVVAVDIPGTREAFGPSGAHCLVPPGDVDGLADRISDLADDGRLRAEIGHANREWATSRFSPERMLQQTVELIAEAI